MAYLLVAKRQMEDHTLAGSYNVGPDECDCVTTGTLAELFCEIWGQGMSWISCGSPTSPHEANYLRLDCSKMKNALGWHPRWHIDTAVKKTVDWVRAWQQGQNTSKLMCQQIIQYAT